MHLSFFLKREVTTKSGLTAHADRSRQSMSDSKLHSKPKVPRMQKFAAAARGIFMCHVFGGHVSRLFESFLLNPGLAPASLKRR